MNTTAKAEPGTSISVAHKQAITGIDKMRDTFADSLPSDVSPDKFTSVVKTALNTNPDLLKADRQSLYNECVRAAQDGLLPDGREGALVTFGGKVKWMPMIGGLRKKAAKHGFDLIAQVVYENDEFEFQLGDEPKILHVPVPLNQESGPIVGFYAIATEKTTGAKYREVMNKAEVDAVRAVSKTASTAGGPWDKWYAEQGRKTVCRRLFKQLPFYMEDDIQKIVASDQEEYEIDHPPVAGSAPAQAPDGVRGKILGTGQDDGGTAATDDKGGADGDVI